MAYLSVEQVNAWLAETKFQVPDIDVELERGVVDYMVGKLSDRYVVSSWTDDQSTPSIVLNVMGMLYAAWYLQRQVGNDAGDLTDSSYPVRLERRAFGLFEDVATGAIELPDELLVAGGGPLFYPNDASTSSDPSDPDHSPRAFSMTMEF
jgi:hypothetical protein